MRNSKESRRLKRSRHGLPDINVTRNDSAIDRSVNGGVIQIGFGDGDRCLLLLCLRRGLRDLRLGRAQCRVRSIRVCFGKIELLLAHDTFFSQS